MRTSNWAGSWYPPTGQPLGQGFLEMCPQWSLQNTALHRFLAHALQMYACTCITNEMRMLQITNDMCILH